MARPGESDPGRTEHHAGGVFVKAEAVIVTNFFFHSNGTDPTMLGNAKWDFSAADALFEEPFRSSRLREEVLEPKVPDCLQTDRSHLTLKVRTFPWTD